MKQPLSMSACAVSPFEQDAPTLERVLAKMAQMTDHFERLAYASTQVEQTGRRSTATEPSSNLLSRLDEVADKIAKVEAARSAEFEELRGDMLHLANHVRKNDLSQRLAAVEADLAQVSKALEKANRKAERLDVLEQAIGQFLDRIAKPKPVTAERVSPATGRNNVEDIAARDGGRASKPVDPRHDGARYAAATQSHTSAPALRGLRRREWRQAG